MSTSEPDKPLSWTSGTKVCPKCGARFERSHRTRQDEWVSFLFGPVRRYRCRSSACGYDARLKAMTISPGTWPGLLPLVRRHAFVATLLLLVLGVAIAAAVGASQHPLRTIPLK